MKKNKLKKSERVVETLVWRPEANDVKAEQVAVLKKYASQLREVKKVLPWQ